MIPTMFQVTSGWKINITLSSVVPKHANNPNEVSYFPPPDPSTPPLYEYVIHEEAQVNLHTYDSFCNDLKVFPQFIVRFAKKPSTPVPAPAPSSSGKSTPVTSWSVDDVVGWMKSLRLKKDNSSIIQSNDIDGDALMMMQSEHFKEIGITVMRNLLRIQRGLAALK